MTPALGRELRLPWRQAAIVRAESEDRMRSRSASPATGPPALDGGANPVRIPACTRAVLPHTDKDFLAP